MQVGYRTYLAFAIYYGFTILSLAIIEETVVVDHLTGQSGLTCQWYVKVLM